MFTNIEKITELVNKAIIVTNTPQHLDTDKNVTITYFVPCPEKEIEVARKIITQFWIASLTYPTECMMRVPQNILPGYIPVTGFLSRPQEMEYLRNGFNILSVYDRSRVYLNTNSIRLKGVVTTLSNIDCNADLLGILKLNK